MRNYVGETFGRWTVVEYAPRRRGGAYSYCRCRCSCGTERQVSTSNLRNGLSVSCGCLRREQGLPANRTHGRAGTSLYNIWCNIKARCQKPQNPAYPYYGGRGIKLCERWQSFENFAADMGERPPGLTVDRMDSNGDYEPGNCRWATREEQSNNTSANRFIVFQGRRQTIGKWARELRVPPHKLYHLANRGADMTATLAELAAKREEVAA
jgi:hypothetical protein